MSLANTTWNAALNAAGTQKWKFNSDGTVSVTFPNSNTGTMYFSEAADGTFVVQSPKSTVSPNIIQIYTGKHQNGQGTGYYVGYEGQGNLTTLIPFTMTKAGS